MPGSRVGMTTGEPVERFKPTSGRIPGIAGLIFVGGAGGYLAWDVHTLAGFQVGSALVLFAVVIWVTQLRPRATAYAETLVLHNMLRDTFIPLRLIDDISVRQTMHVWVGDKKYVCVGVGRTVRKLTGHKGPSARVLGMGKMSDEADRIDVPHPEHTAMPYATFVETRLYDLVGYARKGPVTDPDAQVRRTWAIPEVVALAATSLLFVVSLLVG